jgi:hypothetical protein
MMKGNEKKSDWRGEKIRHVVLSVNVAQFWMQILDAFHDKEPFFSPLTSSFLFFLFFSPELERASYSK